MRGAVEMQLPGTEGPRAPQFTFVVVAPVRSAATTTAVAIAEAAAAAGLETGLIDLAPPYRGQPTSGTTVGALTPTAVDDVCIRTGLRGSGVEVARIESSDSIVQTQFCGRHRIPAPSTWLSAMRPNSVVVVDFSWPLVEELSGIGSAPGAWMNAPVSYTVPVVVLEPSMVAVDRCESLVTALRDCQLGDPQFVIPRVSKVPSMIRDAAGAHLLAALSKGVITPMALDKGLAAGGIGAEIPKTALETGRRVLAAAGAIAPAKQRRGR